MTCMNYLQNPFFHVIMMKEMIMSAGDVDQVCLPSLSAPEVI